MFENGLDWEVTPPPILRQEPALKAGFLLPGIPCHRGFSRSSAGATRARKTPRIRPGSPPFSSLFSTYPHQPAAVGTGRTLVVARGYAGVAESGRNRRLEQQSGCEDRGQAITGRTRHPVRAFLLVGHDEGLLHASASRVASAWCNASPRKLRRQSIGAMRKALRK